MKRLLRFGWILGLLAACGTPGPPCDGVQDCPDPGPCQQAACVGGQCEPEPRRFGVEAPDDNPDDCVTLVCDGLGGLTAEHRPAGTLVGDDKKGDCKALMCDGNGRALLSAYKDDPPEATDVCVTMRCVDGHAVATPRPEGTDAGDPTPGDCAALRCDGNGKAISEEDLTDAVDDGKPCTWDRCVGGKSGHVPVPAGVTVADDTDGNCLGMRCDGNGGGTSVPMDKDLPTLTTKCLQGTCTMGQPGAAQAPVGSTCDHLGGLCRPSGMCSACPDPGPTCTDTGVGEPNDTEGQAHDLGTIDDKDLGEKWPSVCGVLAGAKDVDWFVYRGRNSSSGIVDPHRKFVANAGLSVCAFFKCDVPAASFECPAGTTKATSPGGLPGCCGDKPFTVDLKCADGKQGEPNARVFVRVQQKGAAECTPYALQYHY